MTDKNKKLIVKMAAIIKQQQALINKLAQFAPNSQGDPLAGLDLNEKSQATLAQEAKARAAAAAAAAAKAAPKPVAPATTTPAATPWGKVDTTGYWDASKPLPGREPTSFTRENVRQPTSMTRGPDNKPMDVSKADDTAALPPDVVAALDETVQGVKGFLFLDIDQAKNVTVRYNSSAIKAGNAKVQQVLSSALSPLGYKVTSVFGETNVIPNYKN